MSEEKQHDDLDFADFLSQINLMDLALFEQAAQQLSLSKAAEKLGEMPEATASRRLRRLEELLESRLFERTSRQLTLTDDGEVYLRQVATILDSFRELQRIKHVVHSHVSGTLKVGADTYFADMLSREFFSLFMRSHPNIAVNLHQVALDELDSSIKDMDLVICGRLPTTQSVGLHMLCQWKSCFFASRDYLNKHGWPKHPRDLDGHCILMTRILERTAGKDCIAWVDTDGTTYRQPIKHALYSDTAGMLINLASQGAGILWAPEHLRQLVGNDLEVLFDGRYGITFDVYALFPSARHMPKKVAVFLSALQSYLADILSGGR